MGHSRWHLRHIGCLDGQRLVADAVLRATLEQYVRLLDVMHVESGAAAGVRLGDDERERLEAVLLAREAMRELARHAVVMIHLVKIEEESGRVVRLLRGVRELFFGPNSITRRVILAVPSYPAAAERRY